jgi:galactokinase/mevalonate kinase-like predicted kinase
MEGKLDYSNQKMDHVIGLAFQPEEMSKSVHVMMQQLEDVKTKLGDRQRQLDEMCDKIVSELDEALVKATSSESESVLSSAWNEVP